VIELIGLIAALDSVTAFDGEAIMNFTLLQVIP
jgi:hypothetical protein